jgi:hypothetical protein
MEPFRIALYGMAQVTAIVYGVLANGAAVKLNSSFAEHGYTMPIGYHLAVFYRDYGFFLLLFVVGWAVAAGCLAVVPSKWVVDEKTITITGIGLTVFFAILGTVLAFAGAAPPAVSLF